MHYLVCARFSQYRVTYLQTSCVRTKHSNDRPKFIWTISGLSVFNAQAFSAEVRKKRLQRYAMCTLVFSSLCNFTCVLFANFPSQVGNMCETLPFRKGVERMMHVNAKSVQSTWWFGTDTIHISQTSPCKWVKSVSLPFSDLFQWKVHNEDIETYLCYSFNSAHNTSMCHMCFLWDINAEKYWEKTCKEEVQRLNSIKERVAH